nr:MAG TPA: antitoxin [Caudoviricetes sp.]
MEGKFLVSLPTQLRAKIKREARRNGISMNDYIVTVLEQFVELQGVKSGRTTTQNTSGQSS